MELRLTLEGPERLLGGQSAASMREGTLLIGRSPEADWAIPDPEKIISKVHCRIEKASDTFQVTDLSTNGVRVNDAAVGYGLTRRIEHGDVIRLGDAVLSVEIAASEPTAPAVIPSDDVFLGDGPFAEALPAQQKQATPAAPAPVESVPTGAATGVVLDDWWQPDGGQSGPPAANPVDISVQPASAANVHVHSQDYSLWSHETGAARLLSMAAGFDMEEFVQAVDAAAASLTPSEQVRFRERLSEILRNASGR